MERLIFNETNIFILSKLVSIVKKETGRRHKLATEASITELLTDVSNLQHARVQAYYEKFLYNLTAEQLHELRLRGINVPDGMMKKRGLFPTHIPKQYAFTPN